MNSRRGKERLCVCSGTERGTSVKEKTRHVLMNSRRGKEPCHCGQRDVHLKKEKHKYEKKKKRKEEKKKKKKSTLTPSLCVYQIEGEMFRHEIDTYSHTHTHTHTQARQLFLSMASLLNRRRIS